MKHIERAVRLVDRISSPLLDSFLRFISHSRRLDAFIQQWEDKSLRKLNNPHRFLIVPDVNIGDALNHQPFAEVLKKCFPESEIHYIYKKKAFPLIKANPYVDVHHPLFEKSGIPSQKDMDELKKILIKNSYDIAFNFCPYLSFSALKYHKTKVIYPIRFMSRVIRALSSNIQKAHLTLQLNQLAKNIACRIDPAGFDQSLCKDAPLKHRLYASGGLLLRSEKTAEKLGISFQKKTVFFNPDSSSPYTLIPLKLQIEIMKAVLSSSSVDQVLMNKGYSYLNIETNILNEIPEHFKRKIILLPQKTPLDVYVALADKADIFISADTGPMHIAAAEKVFTDSYQTFRNKTAVIGIFGATPSKLYGYDSFSDEHLDSFQNAPARAFEGNPSCKNITCIDKSFKKCSQVRCFDGIDTEEIISYFESLL